MCSLLSSTRPPGAAALGAPSRWWQQKSCRDASSLLCPCSPPTVAAGRMLSPSKRLQPVAKPGPLLPVPCGSCAASRADPCCQPRSLPVPARLAQGEQPSPSPRAREARSAEQVFTDTFFFIYLFIYFLQWKHASRFGAAVGGGSPAPCVLHWGCSGSTAPHRHGSACRGSAQPWLQLLGGFGLCPRGSAPAWAGAGDLPPLWLCPGSGSLGAVSPHQHGQSLAALLPRPSLLPGTCPWD